MDPAVAQWDSRNQAPCRGIVIATMFMCVSLNTKLWPPWPPTAERNELRSRLQITGTLAPGSALVFAAAAAPADVPFVAPRDFRAAVAGRPGSNDFRPVVAVAGRAVMVEVAEADPGFAAPTPLIKPPPPPPRTGTTTFAPAVAGRWSAEEPPTLLLRDAASADACTSRFSRAVEPPDTTEAHSLPPYAELRWMLHG